MKSSHIYVSITTLLQTVPTLERKIRVNLEIVV